jgi:hypothetical protein
MTIAPVGPSSKRMSLLVQGDDLAVPHAGVVGQQDDRVQLEVRLAGRGEELLVVDLLVMRLLELGLLEPLDPGHAGDDVPLDRRVKHRIEPRQHLVDRRCHVATGASGLQPLHRLGIDLVETERPGAG